MLIHGMPRSFMNRRYEGRSMEADSMKVGILSASVSHRAGGIYECVRRSAQELQNRFLPSVRVYGLTDDYFENDRESWGSLGVSVFQARGFKPFGYSPDLLSALLSADV